MMILTKNYSEPPICEKEILRYAGCKSSDEELLQLSVVQNTVNECIEEIRQKLAYKVCYAQLPVTIAEDVCDFGCMKVQSRNLAKNLQGCKTTIIFAATIGVEIDRLITKYSRISPTKALIFQAIGAERIEALCDAFCADIGNLLKVDSSPRFSPGYGDLPLEIQKDIFQILDCSKRIGVSLNDSLLMSPSKSVTAFVGLMESQDALSDTTNKTGENHQRNQCVACNKTDCEYRGV